LLKYFIVFIIVINIFLSLSGEREIIKVYKVEATANKIWEQYILLNKYTKYNETLKIEREGNLFLDSSLKYIIQKDNNIENIISARIEYIEKNKIIVLKGGIPGLLFFEREINIKDNGILTTIEDKTLEKGWVVWMQNIISWDPTLPFVNWEEVIKKVMENKNP